MARNAYQGRDLLLFLDVAGELQKGTRTLGELSEAIKIPPAVLPISSLHDAIKRIDASFPEKVFKIVENSIRLTQFGLQIQDDLTSALANCGDRKATKQLRLTASNALLTSGVLASAIRDFIRRKGRRVQLHMKLHSMVDINQILSDFYTEEIDLAFIWGTVERLRELRSSPVHFETLPTRFDVVVISFSKDLIDSIDCRHQSETQESLSDEVSAAKRSKKDVVKASRKTSDKSIRQLSEKVVVTLGFGAQVSSHLIPLADPFKGGRRIEVDTVEAAIACVCSRLADAAIVPAIYPELNRLRLAGKLSFSLPVDQVPVVFLQSLTASAAVVDEFLEDVKSHLVFAGQNPFASENGERIMLSSQFPMDDAWYRELKYGYYIGADIETEDGEITWCWEIVSLESSNVVSNNSESNTQLHFQGGIKNQFEVSFKIHEAIASKEAFLVRAGRVDNQSKPGTIPMSCSEFISVFTACWEHLGIISGTWSGRDRERNSGVFGTIWSKKQLSVPELRMFSQQSSFHSVLSAERGIDFDRQPEIHEQKAD